MYHLKPNQLPKKRPLSETERRLAFLMPEALAYAKLLRDGKIPDGQRARAADAVVQWLEESVLLGEEIINATRNLVVEDDGEPMEPNRPAVPDDEVDSVPAEPAREPEIGDLGPKLGVIEPGKITYTHGMKLECHRSYAATAVRDNGNTPGWWEVRGDCSNGVNSLGGGSTPWASDAGWWENGKLRVGFKGVGEHAKLGEIGLRQFMNDGTEHGVDHLWLETLTVQARHNMAIGSFKGDTNGLLTMRACKLSPDPGRLQDGHFGGFGFKWGMRCNGRGRYDIKGLICDPVQEHAIYVDALTGDTRFEDIIHTDSWRTAIQVVSRSIDNPGPVSTGNLLFKNVQATFKSQGEGGSAITVAGGHDGDITIDGLTVIEDHGRAANHGAVVIWVTAKPHHGAYLWTASNEEYRAYRKVELSNLDLNLWHYKHHLVAVRGAELVRAPQALSDRGSKALLIDGNYQLEGDYASVDRGPVRVVPDMEKVRTGRVELV